MGVGRKSGVHELIVSGNDEMSILILSGCMANRGMGNVVFLGVLHSVVKGCRGDKAGGRQGRVNFLSGRFAVRKVLMPTVMCIALFESVYVRCCFH